MAGHRTAAEQMVLAADGGQLTVDVRRLAAEERTIDATWLAAWLTGGRAPSSVTIVGATIGPGPLVLTNAVLPGLLCLDRCTVASLNLDGSTAGVLNVRFGRLGDVSADSLRARRLSFACSEVRGVISLRTAQIEDQLIASGARIRPASANARALNCYGIRVGSSVVLWVHESTNRRTEIDGMVDFSDADIGARFTLADAVVNCPSGVAVSLSQARVAGSVVLDGATIRGQVRLPLARVAGELTAIGATLTAGQDQVTVNASRIEAGNVTFDRASVTGTLDFTGASSRGDLSMLDGSLTAAAGSRYALRVDLATIGGSLRVSGSVGGEIRLSHAAVNGDVNLGGCTIRHQPQALTADSARVQGRLRLSPSFGSTGTIVLLAAQLRDLDAAGAHLAAPVSTTGAGIREEPAVELDRAEVTNDISFKGAVVQGRIVARDTRIGGALDCDHVTIRVLDIDNDPALDLENTVIAGNFLLRGATLAGGLRAPALDVSHLAIGQATSIEHPGDVALGLLHLHVRKRLSLGTITVNGAIDLAHAWVADLDDRWEGWAGADHIDLDGFKYATISMPVSGAGDRADQPSAGSDAGGGERDGRLDTARRLAWLKKTKKGQPFRPGPYDQLASVYRSQGEPNWAIEVLIERENERLRADTEAGLLAVLRRTGRRVLKHTVRHGYRPGRAVWALLVTIAGLALLLAFGPNHQEVFVANAAGRPRADLNPVVYAADTVLPIIDFDQASAWRADAGRPWAGLYRVAIWISVLVGWVLSSLLVAAITTVARTER